MLILKVSFFDMFLAVVTFYPNRGDPKGCCNFANNMTTFKQSCYLIYGNKVKTKKQNNKENMETECSSMLPTQEETVIAAAGTFFWGGHTFQTAQIPTNKIRTKNSGSVLVVFTGKL